MEENPKKNWATGTLKEAPFWRDDMQPEEYDIEREYFYKHYEDIKMEYMSLCGDKQYQNSLEKI